MFVSLQICWLVKPVINKVEYSKFLHVLSTCRKLPPYFLREKNSRKRLFITEYCLESRPEKKSKARVNLLLEVFITIKKLGFFTSVSLVVIFL